MAEPTPTKPYLLRAIYEWCVDNGYTPYVSVVVDGATRVPMEYVRDGEIVLNIGPLASSKLHMGNELIECSARFSGAARELSIPVGSVAAIYAKENGQGMSFEVARNAAPLKGGDAEAVEKSGEPPEPNRPSGGRPALRRVK
jgi:stringent starvation protein B